MRYCPWRNRSIDTVDLKKEKHTMRRFLKYLLPALLLALCLSLAACVPVTGRTHQIRVLQ